MPSRKKITWAQYAEMCEYLIDHSVKQTALHYKVSESTIRSRIQKLRDRLYETQSAINKIRNLQKVSQRVRKFTIKGGIPKEEGED